jgi:cytochrome c oxidase subunit 2
MSNARRVAILTVIAAASLLTTAVVRSRARPIAAPPSALRPPGSVLATGHGSRWQFRYPGPDGAIGTADDISRGGDLHLPAGSDVELVLCSDDYLYTLSVPEVGLQGMAVPGLPSSVKFRPDRPGTFELAADPLCGRRPAHAGRLIVETLPEFQAWIGGVHD